MWDILPRIVKVYDVNFVEDKVNVFNDYNLRSTSAKSPEEIRKITRGKYLHMQLRRTSLVNIRDVHSIDRSIIFNTDYSLTTKKRYKNTDNLEFGETRRGVLNYLNKHKTTIGTTPQIGGKTPKNIVDVYHQNQISNSEKHWIAGFLDNLAEKSENNELIYKDLSTIDIKNMNLAEHTLNNLADDIKIINENLNDLNEIILNRNSKYNTEQRSTLNYELTKGIKELEMYYREFKKI